LRMPSGVAPTVILAPAGAALAAAKRLALSAPELRGRLSAYEAEMRDGGVAADAGLSS